ncbi:fibronectin type III domain-containing protein 1 isoform X2 [Hippocampus zosterae]|uniref:fibronectin type III domain-containing protein 1 isoform X2 n=1 Tax=Hippocampus zosterae TaxID=109293 RepID=UPI00223D5C63|nr:fibronectin type III domain-containing protein 1 isoform X2 [Hippocampus zosterae]
MALCASSTLLAFFVAFCTPGRGWTAEKPLRTYHGKATSMVKSLRESWEPSIHLDGRPVERFGIGSNRPLRTHRYTRVGKESRSPLVEDVGPVRSTYPAARNQTAVKRAARVNRTTHRPSASRLRTDTRRAPQSSTGPRSPQRGFFTRTTSPAQRHRHNTKPQSDQRNRNSQKLTSESVHVVSLQAQKAQGQSAPANHAATKTTTPEPPEYEAKDISVRVMSPKSVLISWVDPAVEMGKIESSEFRSYTVRYREKGESARWEFKESTQRRVMVDTLSADSMYEFAVRISQGEDDGKWSVSVFQRTPESAPSGPPENFEVKPLRGKGTAVTATWDPPEETNGRIREYILSYAPALKPFGMKSMIYRGSTTSATIDGLTPGDRYIFKIKATNRRGQGPLSKAFSVVMPGSSSAVSSFSRTKDSQRTNYKPSKYDITKDKSVLQSTEAPEEPTKPTEPRNSAPVSKRVRPLSQTRSYHSILSSVRGSVRNGVNRGRTSGREDEDDEDERIPTTSPPEEAATTTESELETKEPYNDVSPEAEDDIYSEVDEPPTEMPSLKVFTLSPTKPTLVYPQQRKPIKLRVHQKGGRQTSSSSSLSFPPKLSSPSTTSLRNTESEDKRKETVSTPLQSKDISKEQTIENNKPTIPVVKDKTQPQTERTAASKESTSFGRTNGSGFGTRNGYGRRNLGIPFRVNSTRMINGNRLGLSAQSRLPSRSQNQATSQSTLPDQSIKQQISNSFNEATVGSTSDGRINGKATSETSTSEEKQITLSSPSNSPVASDTNTGKTNPYVSNAGSQSSHKTETPKTSPERATTNGELLHQSNFKNTEATKIEEPTSSYKEDPTEEKKEKEASLSDKTTRTKISPSLLERSKFLSRLGSGTRLSFSRQGGRTPWSRGSSSTVAGRPILQGIPSKDTVATSSAAVSSIQETSESPTATSSHDSPKNNEMGVISFKPSLTDINSEHTNSRHPPPPSSSSNADSHHATNVKSSDNDHNHDEKDDLENSGINKNVAETTVDRKNPAITSTETHRNAEDNDSAATRDTPSRTNSSSGVPPIYRRPNIGMNGRIRSPHLATRQFGGSRLPTRSQSGHNSRLGSSTTSDSSSSSSAHSSSSNLLRPILTSDRNASRISSTRTGGLTDGRIHSISVSPSSSRESSRGQGGRSRFPILRGKTPNGGARIAGNGNAQNGQPNLTARNKESSDTHGMSKAVGQRLITGPDGNKWLLDLELGILMNQDGKVLQDSQGQPKRVVLGQDGRTIFDHLGSPLLNQDGMALFGHGRDSRPVVNPKEKILMVGGKPLLGLDLSHLRTTTTTTTSAPTTTPEPTTAEWTTEESTTEQPYPTCPPGTFSKIDDYGDPVLDSDGILDCFSEDDLLLQTTLPPATTTTPPTTTMTTTTTEMPTPDTRSSGRGPLSEFDDSGKRRFTAPYVNYIQKDPGAPCSLTEALEYLQVDILDDLIKNDTRASNQKQHPKNKPHNLTVVAMEGCHSFIILDWGRPLKDDMVSGYMVYSASYDDVLNNRWSSKVSSGTHLAVENLKPNSRYYFKVQAKNVFGLGPVSETLTYVTESDDPLLIVRPPGGEPIWIPFSFRYNSAHSSCKGSQYVKRTWYRKFVGVVLCNSLRYKIFMGDGLREPFYSIGDTVGQGEDHCQFVDSHRDGRTGPAYLSLTLPSAQGYYRAYRQEPVTFGVIGRRTSHPFVGWYECGVPIPGKW